MVVERKSSPQMTQRNLLTAPESERCSRGCNVEPSSSTEDKVTAYPANGNRGLLLDSLARLTGVLKQFFVHIGPGAMPPAVDLCHDFLRFVTLIGLGAFVGPEREAGRVTGR